MSSTGVVTAHCPSTSSSEARVASPGSSRREPRGERPRSRLSASGLRTLCRRGDGSVHGRTAVDDGMTPSAGLRHLEVRSRSALSRATRLGASRAPLARRLLSARYANPSRDGRNRRICRGRPGTGRVPAADRSGFPGERRRSAPRRAHGGTSAQAARNANQEPGFRLGARRSVTPRTSGTCARSRSPLPVI